MMMVKKTSLSWLFPGGVVVLVAVATLWPQRRASADDMKIVPPPAIDAPATGKTLTGKTLTGKTLTGKTATEKTATAVFAGGCFWGVQGVYQHVKGVTSAISGYSGGDKSTASYPIVSTGASGHAESVKITYDPSQVSYGKLFADLLLRRDGPDPAEPPGSR